MKFMTSLIMLGIIGAICTSSVSQTSPQEPDKEGDLIIIMYNCRARNKPILEYAAWSNGICFRLGDGQKPIWYRTVGSTGFNMNFLKKTSMFGLKTQSYLVPDSSYKTIQIMNSGLIQRCSWDEIIQPGWGPNVNSDGAYRLFVQSWYELKLNIASIPVSLCQDLSESTRDFLLDCANRSIDQMDHD